MGKESLVLKGQTHLSRSNSKGFNARPTPNTPPGASRWRGGAFLYNYIRLDFFQRKMGLSLVCRWLFIRQDKDGSGEKAKQEHGRHTPGIPIRSNDHIN